MSSKISTRDQTIKIKAPKNQRVTMCWKGGAIVSSLNSFNKLWISKKDWEEEGLRILFARLN